MDGTPDTNVVESTAQPLLIPKANAFVCYAKFTNDAGANYPKIGAAAGGDTYTKLQKTATWWCSDGSNNLTNMLVEEKAVPTPKIKTGVAITNPNGLSDPRLEFFLVSCRQRIDLCGAAVIPDMTTIAVGSAD